MTRLMILFFLMFACGCRPASQAQSIKTGAHVLVESNFERLQGLRVGLIVNHTARVADNHLINLVHDADGVTVAALFGPEHGLRGTEEYGVSIDDGVDDITGAPVYSLYGETRQPTPAMLEGLDALVYDIQDVGARFYTFISTMGLAMQAAAKAGQAFIVLDRPNPLSGNYVAGFLLEPEQTSFVGQYAIPIAHGLTVGELVRMIKGERLLPGLEDLELEVIAMEGWTRDMQWPDTNLPWVSTSPNIPDFKTALIYIGTCFFEATSASEGRGTAQPFEQVGAPWADGVGLARQLNGYNLPGGTFEATRFTPRPTKGMDMNPKLSGQDLGGLRVNVTERLLYRPVEAGIYILHAFYNTAPDSSSFLSRPQWLARLSGTTRLHSMLGSMQPEDIIASWQQEVDEFAARSRKYHLYD